MDPSGGDLPCSTLPRFLCGAALLAAGLGLSGAGGVLYLVTGGRRLGGAGVAWRVAVGRLVRGVALQSGPKPGGPACRLGRGSCNTRALGASSARTEGVRYNAVACYRSQVRLGFNRPKLKSSRGLVDKLVFPEVQGHSAMTKVMSKLFMHSRCLTKCHRHLGISWSGQFFQISVSLDAQEGGEVSW